ncbi:amidohydrolase [Streptomyces sp. NPDC127584]|uniref:amidohydrolase n=1 Tax=Streptomyces sp. NPDC127584 TaxID=3345403 RepID=UPI00363C3F35
MKPRRLASALVASLLVAALSSCDGSTRATADDGTRATVVVNAEVYTLDPDRPWARAFAYDADGKIIAVGTEPDVRAKAGSGATVIDARGNTVLPGFQDTHLHVPEAGINRDLCFMESGQTLAAYEDMAADCAAEQPDSAWVRAAGPSIFDLLDADEAPIDVLDRAIPDRPALILDDLGHAVWTNTLGLKAAGIAPDAANPQGGIYGRDPDTGRLNGLVLENAQQRLRNAAAPDDETVYRGLLVALDELAKNGITSVSDAGGFWGQNHPAAWQRALQENELSVRAVNSLYVYPDHPMDQQLSELKKRFSDDPDSLLRFNTAKIYVDGILDLGTAWMLKPYDKPIDPEHPSGFPYFQRDQLRSYVDELHRIGYRMEFHVIGDAATREALDAVEAIDADPGQIADRRHRTTHTYLVHPDDIERFKELGVIADFQAGPEAIDAAYHEQLSQAIGDRAFDLIPTKKLIAAGARVSLSSDWDADPLSPFGIIERSVTRDSNAVDNVATALRLVTLDAAYALGQDDTTGSIEIGKQADYTVVDQNILKIPVDRVDQTKVLVTVLAGHPTYQAESFDR